jgi:transposase, IS30 family
MTKPKYRRLTCDDRRVIENMSKAKNTQSDIAKAIGVSQSTISRELSRNSADGIYKHIDAFAHMYFRLLLKPRRYIVGEQEAEILETYLKKKWSPETISAVCFERRICHQTLYNYIERNRQTGGKLYKLLYLRKSRRKRYGTDETRGQIRNKVSIEARPEVVAQKTRFGDWEGDLIMGKNHKGAMLTLVERKSKYLCAARLSGKNAEETKNNTIRLLRKMTAHTITFDNGKEFSQHEEMSRKLKSDIYFAHPYTSSERGLNEYTNRLLRQYFPKKMDLRKATERELKFALNEINTRPRKTLNWKSPNEYIGELIRAAP